jgi:hypothetical protein
VNFGQVAKITKATLAAVACRTKGITSISQSQYPDNIARDFLLRPNYPNPFNASTVISYHLRTAGQLKIDVFNSQGERVAEILNQWYPAGDYQKHWEAIHQNGQTLPSGLYFIRMILNQGVESRKIMLIK